MLASLNQGEVNPELTETLKRFVDVVPAKEGDLEGYRVETVYKLKPEFEKYFGDKPNENTR